MLDSHCHLTDPRILSQIDAVMTRAAAAGVTRIAAIGTTPPDWDACLEVCQNWGNVRCALGVHPNHCYDAELTDIPRLRDLLAEPGVVALGEVGLDYHHRFVPVSRQREFLEAQLQVAVELSLPVVVHSRESVDDCLEVIRNFPVQSAVFHCFTGTAAEAGRIFDAGFLIGFTGVVTFKNAAALRDVARSAPADRILVETDAPYLAPEPKRSQKVNEPALVILTAAAVAAARGVGLEEIDRLTTENALRFYRWETA